MASRRVLDVSRIVVVPGRIDQNSCWEFRRTLTCSSAVGLSAMKVARQSRDRA